jgi:hypothetical protein
VLELFAFEVFAMRAKVFISSLAIAFPIIGIRNPIIDLTLVQKPGFFKDFKIL